MAGITTRPNARLATHWKLATPEYLLLLVITVILWTFGFIELLDRTSTNAKVFGLYTTRYFVGLVAYSLGFLLWGGLLARPYHSAWLSTSVRYIQNRSWLALGLLIASGILVWHFIHVAPYTDHPLVKLAKMPAVRFSVVALLVLGNGVIVFGGWTQTQRVQPWRSVVALIAAAGLGIEVLVQLLAYASLLPGTHTIANLYVPYGKVYYNAEGFSHSTINNYGWYYPDFRLRQDSTRIVVLGDTFIQALQIDPAQHLGVKLETLLKSGQERPAAASDIEVLALGMPGFGPGLYLSNSRLEHTVTQFRPHEIILFFDLSSDFQTVTQPSENDIVFVVHPEGNVDLHPDSVGPLHNLKHFILDGYEQTIDPLSTLWGHYLTPRLFGAMLHQPNASPPLKAMDILSFRGVVIDKTPTLSTFSLVRRTGTVKTPGASNFLFEKRMNRRAKEAVAIATSLLKQTHDYLASQGVILRIVTLPAFPQAFYTQYHSGNWEPEVGDYDLFLPDRALRAFAQDNHIPFLSMGQYMYETHVEAHRIKALYYLDGQGHLTPQGHDYVAQAIKACFYSDAAQRNHSDGCFRE